MPDLLAHDDGMRLEGFDKVCDKVCDKVFERPETVRGQTSSPWIMQFFVLTACHHNHLTKKNNNLCVINQATSLLLH